MSQLNRRNALALVASLPALGVPAVAAASQPDAELIAIGEEMKPHIVNASKLGRVSHQLYEIWNELTGPIPAEYGDAYQRWRERCDLLAVETGYCDASARWNEATSPVYELAERALELPATTLAGYRVQAMAIVATDPDLAGHGERAWHFLITLAREAGYPNEVQS